MANTLDAFVSNAGATTKVNGANALGKRVDGSMAVTMQRLSCLLQNFARDRQLVGCPLFSVVARRELVDGRKILGAVSFPHGEAIHFFRSIG